MQISAMAGSIIDGKPVHDHFDATHPTTNWRVTIDYAEEMGLGTRDYELIRI